MPNKTYAALLIALAALAAFAAAPAWAGKSTLTVATFPDLDRAAKAAAPTWARLHPDIELKIVSLQYADHHTAMTTALATGSGLPDVMALDFRFIGKFAASGGLEDLARPPYNGLALREQFVRYTFPQALNADGALAAIPADIGPGTLLYRKDLIDKAGVTEQDLTRSWASYLAAGQKIKAATGAYLMADAADLRDILLRAGLKDGEGIYFDKRGQVLVQSPRFVQAFELGRAARRAGLDAGAPAWTNDWAAGFKQGRIATQMMGAWLTGHLRNWLAPDTSGLWRSAVLPGGVYASYGGSFYAIPKKAANKQSAWEFIRLLTADKETQLNSLRLVDNFPALVAAQQDPLFDEPMPFLGGQKARQLWRDIAAQVPAIPVNKYDAVATAIIRDEFEQVLSEGKEIAQALLDARVLIEHRARRR
ncbi:extracellular solute-binding protein [Pelomonas sp. V22]|uniref:ABC transporter substrate-binding protein n=1 Tax=Pelomonas sp. V22 TaxID=2822139 RepID=UPI0024A8909E|nr:extracellular solute-binding protein [Pelomonas sp. V22]MDI4632851.1 extracellular solute-binding protein [Pelomonas sp. V22]